MECGGMECPYGLPTVVGVVERNLTEIFPVNQNSKVGNHQSEKIVFPTNSMKKIQNKSYLVQVA